MKIAIDARSLEKSKTGVGRYLSNLLRFWKNDRKNEFYLYFKDEIPKDDFLISSESPSGDSDGAEGFKSGNFTLRLLKNPLGFSSNFFFQHFLLPYNLAKDKADFFFSPFYLKSFYCSVKSAIVLHDISYEAHPEWFDFKSQFILRILSKYSAKTADKIFAVSNYSKNEIIKYYKINPEKITVTYLAPDSGFADTNKNLCRWFHSSIRTVEPHMQGLHSGFHSPEAGTMEPSAIKEKYNLKNKFILSVGSIFNRRHIPEIVEAFEKLALKYKDYQLLIIGKNHTHPFVDIDNMTEIANQKLGRNAIIHLDFASEEELQIFYSSCELSIYLSDYEGFGLPIAEAQFFGKPVITSYNSSLVEVGDSSVEFVKNNTVEEIYNSMNKVIFDESYKNKLIKSGGENIKRFSWERCAGETLDRILNVEF